MKKRILLIAFILGICFFGSMVGILDNYISTFSRSLTEKSQGELILFRFLSLAFLLQFISLPAIILNILGWLKNGTKKILIAAILYLVSTNIPSAVLCFIGFNKLKTIKS